MFKIGIMDVPDLDFLQDTVENCMDAGIKVADTSKLVEVIAADRDKYLQVLRERYKIANPNSSVQVIAAFQNLSEYFPDIEEVCVDKRTGKWSTKAENLEELRLRGIGVAFDLARYRTLNNMLSSIASVNSFKDGRGLIHPDVSYGKTGRINYANPGLMNINKRVLWSLIEPRDKDATLYSIDIKNQEPWILINDLGIYDLQKVIDGESGLYESIYELWFGRKCNPIERREFKIAWNALSYGGTKKVLAERCKHINYERVYKMFNSIPELKEYKQACNSMGFGGKREIDTIFGRTMVCDGNKGMQLARQLMDYRMQGSGVDILAHLNSHLSEVVEERGWEELVIPYFFRHDELIIQINDGLIEHIGEEGIEDFLKDTFQHQVDEWVPFEVKISKIESGKMPDLTFEEDE